MDPHCQCNYTLKGTPADWSPWVAQWVKEAKPKPGFEWQAWFGDGKAPSFALDLSACWVNNPRDMFLIQNALWLARNDWSNQKIPQSQWSQSAASLRYYWGWNEVPVSNTAVHDPGNWDALAIKLPAALCGHEGYDDSVNCLPTAAQQQLEDDLTSHIEQGFLIPGYPMVTKRPGSYVVFLKEQRMQDGQTWQRFFYCEPWISPNKKYKIVFNPDSASDAGACYIDQA